METKKCNGIFCGGLERSLDEFDVVKGKIRYQCRKCLREKKRIEGAIHYKNNKDKLEIKNALYRKNNREKEKIRSRTYYQNNKQKIHDNRQLQDQDVYLKHLIGILKALDNRNNRDCDIDYEYIMELIKKQNNKCIYSGFELIWSNKTSINKGSVDRINPLFGHIKGNCQLVTININYFKNNLTHNKFMKLIHLIKNSKDSNDNNADEFVDYTNLPVKARAKIQTIFVRMKDRELDRKQKNKTKELIANGYNKKKARDQAIKEITPNDVILDFDYNFFNELRRKCNDRCMLTKIKLTWRPNCINTASIDRINSSLGYEKDNIQITSTYVNYMKNDLPDDIAKQILEQIIAHNSKENNSEENNSEENSSEDNSTENSN